MVSYLRGLESKKDPKDAVKGNSKRSEVAISKKEQEHFESKEKENRDSVTKMTLKSNYRRSSRDKESNRDKESIRDTESKNEKQSHHKSRASNHSGANPEKKSEKKQAKISMGRNKYEENLERKGNENSRVTLMIKSDQLLMVLFPRSKDSGKLRDAEYSERRDQKKEHSRTHHEEPRTKRRRPRSQEYDRERGRPASMSPRSHRRSNQGRVYDELGLSVL